MTTKPERPNLEWFKRRVDYEDDGIHVVVKRSHALWLLAMLKEASEILEADNEVEPVMHWLAKYQGKDNEN